MRKTYEAIMGHTWEVGLRDYAQSRAGTRRGAVEAAGLGSILCDTDEDASAEAL